VFEGMHGAAMPGAVPGAEGYYAKDAAGLIRVEPVYMEKLSLNPRKWQKRWFVLSRNYIVYRKSEDAGSDDVTTSIDLRSVRSITAPKTGALAKDELCFQLELAPAPGAKKQAPVIFRVRSKSKAAAARWAAALAQRKATRRNSMEVGTPEPDLPPRPTAKAAADQEEKRRATEAQLAALNADARRKSVVVADLRALHTESEASAAESAASAAEARLALATAEARMELQAREARRKSIALHGLRERLEAHDAAQAASARDDRTIAAAAAHQQGEIERLRAELTRSTARHAKVRCSLLLCAFLTLLLTSFFVVMLHVDRGRSRDAALDGAPRGVGDSCVASPAARRSRRAAACRVGERAH
jgi:hypothetical protein